MADIHQSFLVYGDKIGALRVFEVADFKSEIRFLKFNIMAAKYSVFVFYKYI